MLDLTNKSFFISRDVVFREESFPFADIEQGQVPKRVFADTLSKDDFLVSNVDHSENLIPSTTAAESVSEGSNEIQSDQVPQPEVLSSCRSSEVVIDVMHSVINPSEPRRSTRTKQTPCWLKDFVSLSVNKDVKYPMCNHIHYAHLSPTYQCYIAATSVIKEPESYSEAVKDPR